MFNSAILIFKFCGMKFQKENVHGSRRDIKSDLAFLHAQSTELNHFSHHVFFFPSSPLVQNFSADDESRMGFILFSTSPFIDRAQFSLLKSGQSLYLTEYLKANQHKCFESDTLLVPMPGFERCRQLLLPIS